MPVVCHECNGTGIVEFTKERGGLVCNNCAGSGHMTYKVMQWHIASTLDFPNVYMGGPSQQSLQKAMRICDHLKDQGFF